MNSIQKFAATLVAISILTLLTDCVTTSRSGAAVEYVNPSWAPPYYSGVRYYYIPDIEVYYDLSGQEFVYLENGQWLFARSLPYMYSGFDLDNCFVVSMDLNVYQPWMHHHYYVSHYPRYYYRNVYREDERVRIRGFNENDKKPIYHRGEVKPRVNEIRKDERPEKKIEYSRQPQNPNYYGKDIGRPVKVRPEMKERKQEIKREAPKEIKRDQKQDNRKEFKREERKEVKPR